MKKSALLELLKDKEVRKVIGKTYFYKLKEEVKFCKLNVRRKVGKRHYYTYKSYTQWKRELKERELI